MNKLLTELRRRNIFRVAGVYAVVGWILMQVAGALETSLRLPDWFDSAITATLLIGFPIALLLAWAFEMTPEGMKRTEAVAEDASIRAKTGRKLDYAIVVGLVLVGALMIWQGTRPTLSSFEAAKNAAPQGEGGMIIDNTVPHPEGSPEAIVSKNANSNTPPPASIAVLPFVDLSPNGDQSYFSDGMAEEILNVLVRVKGLSVASRTSAFGFKGQEALGIPVIAQKLNVRHVLEGSVRKSGTIVRITAQLIDAHTDQHLWSQTFDRTLTAENIFAIQDEIANEIVTQLGIVMDDSSPDGPAVSIKADTKNLDAYELFLRAHNKFLTRKDLPGTIALYERAVAADPRFARAWAGLAAAYVVAPSWGFQDRDYSSLASMSANRAITQNPNLALPYAVLGLQEGDKRPVDFTRAFSFFDEAIKRAPKETTAWLWRGIFNGVLGYFVEAKRDFSQCLAIDPAYENCRQHIAMSTLNAGETKRALELYEQSRMNGPTNLYIWDLAFLSAYAATGKYSVVLTNVYFENKSSGAGNYTPMIPLEYRAITEPDFDFEKERAAIEAAYQHADGKPLDWSSIQGQTAAMLNRNYAAYQAREIAIEVWWYPYPAALKASPHRKRWMIELGLPEFWRKNGFPPQCKPVGENDFECE